MDSDLTLWIGSAAVALSLPVLWWALSGTSVLRRTRAQMGFKEGSFVDLRQADLARPVGERLILPRLSTIGRSLRRLTPAGVVDKLDERLRHAGLSHWGIERVLAIKVLTTLLGLVVGFRIVAARPGVLGLIVAGALVAGAYLLPDALLSSRAEKRRDEIARTLPDLLDQVLISVEAGLAFDSALLRVARSDSGVLAAELARVQQDIALGMRRHDAYDHLLDRADAPQLRQFVNAMKQADRNGVPMANVLRVYARELRQQRSQRAEERAHKIQVKIIFPVVLCILPALMIVMVGPAVIRVADAL